MDELITDSERRGITTPESDDGSSEVRDVGKPLRKLKALMYMPWEGGGVTSRGPLPGTPAQGHLPCHMLETEKQATS